MKDILDDDTKMVNFVKQRPVHSRMFEKVCENLNKLHRNCTAEEEFSIGSLG
jgi:hypothetical protein